MCKTDSLSSRQKLTQHWKATTLQLKTKQRVVKMKLPVVTSCLHQNTFNAELHRRESLNQAATLKHRLEPRTSVPGCLSPHPLSFPSGLSLFTPPLPGTL